ncbi:hypothetical protein R1sor_001873 [Riccia sorocarpa]|uniref:Uncharacterized protein n=1 Tax=Riccia sorocarpa TaxID=122646 RepID=A0ABD3GZ60_9MARC
MATRLARGREPELHDGSGSFFPLNLSLTFITPTCLAALSVGRAGDVSSTREKETTLMQPLADGFPITVMATSFLTSDYLSDNIDLGDLASTTVIVLEAEPFSSTAETPGQEKKKMDSSPAAATDEDQAPEDVVEDPGEGDKEDWEEEEFLLPLEYFVNDCKLPNHGTHPAELPKNLVSDEELVNCFGPKVGKNGRNGHRWDLSKLIPPADVLSLVQVIDGHEKPINGTIGVIFPRALYAERILRQKINWAAFAHDKLKNQLKAHKTRKLAKPTGPPFIRTPKVYRPPHGLISTILMKQ